MIPDYVSTAKRAKPAAPKPEDDEIAAQSLSAFAADVARKADDIAKRADMDGEDLEILRAELEELMKRPLPVAAASEFQSSSLVTVFGG